MLNDLNPGNVLLRCGFTDLRLGIDGLASLVQNAFGLDPFAKGTLFLFCGRKADRIKGLLWEGDGFLLVYKRLETGHFKWPRSTDEVIKMTPQQYRWLMEGLTIEQKTAVKEVYPKKAL